MNRKKHSSTLATPLKNNDKKNILSSRSSPRQPPVDLESDIIGLKVELA